ncbi:MAG: hypothetical protein FWF83_00995 [Clostridiales bacterium]|nr:hypothetical protein [Clostridiales bacterium]
MASAACPTNLSPSGKCSLSDEPKPIGQVQPVRRTQANRDKRKPIRRTSRDASVAAWACCAQASRSSHRI